MAITDRLDGRVAVVTGASAGIGEACAVALAEAGASVVLTARREELLRELADRITANGGTALVWPADVSMRDEVEAVVAAAEDELGRIDILVNNAGLMPVSPMDEVRVDDWTRMVDVNVKGVLYAIGAVLPGMIDRHAGHIVNISSLASRRPFPGGTVYAATKFALRALSWGMHLELGAAHGIRVTDLQPGFVSTDLLDSFPDPALRARWEEAWAERRTLRPADVAQALLFVLTAPEHVSVSELLVRPTDQPT